MPIVQTNSGDPPSGITINNYNQQGEPLLSSKRLEELLRKKNQKKLALYFCIGFALSSVLAIVAYGSTLGVFELFGLFSSKEQCKKRVIEHQLLFSDHLTDSQLSKLTHLVFDMARTDNGTISFHGWIEQKTFMEENERARSLGVKTLIAFFDPQEVIKIGAKRELINSIINFTHDNHLDGIEINEIVLSFQDIQYHLEFCKDLRQKLRTLNRTDFIISLNVISQAPNAAIKDLLQFVDFVSVQTNLYNNFGWKNGEIGPRFPLYGSHSDSKIQNLNQYMKSYSCISGSPSKLNMMVEFKGYHWKYVIPPGNSSDTLWITAEIKNGIVHGGVILWKHLRESRVWNISKASWNKESKTPYIWNPENRTYLVFENERSIKEKMKYAMYENFGGVTINLLNADDDVDSLLNIVSSEQWCLSEVSDEVNYECD